MISYTLYTGYRGNKMYQLTYGTKVTTRVHHDIIHEPTKLGW